MSGFFSSFSSGLGSGLSSLLVGLVSSTIKGDKDDKNYYAQQQAEDKKRAEELDHFVDEQNLQQKSLLKSIESSNDLLEHNFDQERQNKLDETNKHLATIRAYAGLHGTGNTNAIRNQLEKIKGKTDDTINNLKYNTEHQMNTNADKFHNFIDKQKLDYQGLLL